MALSLRLAIQDARTIILFSLPVYHFNSVFMAKMKMSQVVQLKSLILSAGKHVCQAGKRHRARLFSSITTPKLTSLLSTSHQQAALDLCVLTPVSASIQHQDPFTQRELN